MKSIFNFITFYAKLFFAVFLLCMILSVAALALSALNGADISILEIALFSLLNGVVNGFLLSLFAIFILCVIYLFHLAKDKISFRKVSKNHDR